MINAVKGVGGSSPDPSFTHDNYSRNKREPDKETPVFNHYIYNKYGKKEQVVKHSVDLIA